MILVERHRGSRHFAVSVWTPWVLSLALELYSKWPDIRDGCGKARMLGHNVSPYEGEEKARRLLDVFYYALRQPFYQLFTLPASESVCHKLGKWHVFKPVVGKI
jgi:hypothetical protein